MIFDHTVSAFIKSFVHFHFNWTLLTSLSHQIETEEPPLLLISIFAIFATITNLWYLHFYHFYNIFIFYSPFFKNIQTKATAITLLHWQTPKTELLTCMQATDV